MYEIRQRKRTLSDGHAIITFERDIVSANALKVEAGTTGYMGGDTGHGGRTYFRIEDLASTDMTVNVFGKKYSGAGFEVTLGGDCELETIVHALKFIIKVLEDEAHEQQR